jgi:long-chain fatty acid transport protein
MAAVAGAGTDYAANLFSSTLQTTYFNFRFPIGVSWQGLDGMLSLGATANGSWALMGASYGTSIGLPPKPVASSFGGGITLGARVKPLPFLAVGAAYESPTIFQPFEFNIGCANAGATPPGPSAACPGGGYPGGREELELNLPWNASLGVEVTLLEGRLLFLGDAQYIAWSTTLGEGQPELVNDSATITSQLFPLSTNWEDQFVYKIGAQFKATDWLSVRAGYNYGKAPQDPERALENIAFPAFVESHITLGAGIQVSKAVTINLASVIGIEKEISGTGELPDLSPIAGGPLPFPATLSYTASSAGYTIEAGLSVTY